MTLVILWLARASENLSLSRSMGICDESKGFVFP